MNRVSVLSCWCQWGRKFMTNKRKMIDTITLRQWGTIKTKRYSKNWKQCAIKGYRTHFHTDDGKEKKTEILISYNWAYTQIFVVVRTLNIIIVFSLRLFCAMKFSCSFSFNLNCVQPKMCAWNMHGCLFFSLAVRFHSLVQKQQSAQSKSFSIKTVRRIDHSLCTHTQTHKKHMKRLK